jgi:hypothetical protein
MFERIRLEAGMRMLPVLTGGLCAGLVVVAGEALLNLLVLASEWKAQATRLSLPAPTPFAAVQAVLKLLLLGAITMGLGKLLLPAVKHPALADLSAGLLVWLLVWAWVQWGMLIAGYVTPRIATTTVAWGLVELPLAALCGGLVLRWTQTQVAPGDLW